MDKEKTIISIKIDPKENTSNVKYEDGKIDFERYRLEYIFIYARIEKLKIKKFSLEQIIKYFECIIDTIKNNWAFTGKGEEEFKRGLRFYEHEIKESINNFNHVKLSDPKDLINIMLDEVIENNYIIDDCTKLINRYKKLSEINEQDLKLQEQYLKFVLEKLKQCSEFEEIKRLKKNNEDFYYLMKTQFEEVKTRDEIKEHEKYMIDLAHTNYIKLLKMDN